MEELIKAVEAMQSGDENAFQVIYSQTYRQTLNVIRRFCGDANAHEDLLQETYVQLFGHIKEIRDPATVQGWLNITAGRIARHYNIKRVNRNTRLLSEMEDENGNPVEIEDKNEEVRPELIADRKALAEIVNQILNMLPKEQRDALFMVYGKKITIREMAQNLQVSENTIKSRLYQGRRKLMSYKADFRRLGVELPAVGIATIIAVTFEENMEAQAAVGAASSVMLAKTAESEGEAVSTSAVSMTGTSAATAGAKAAAVGMSIGTKVVAGFAVVAVIAGGSAAAFKATVIDKQSNAQSESVTESAVENDVSDDLQDEPKLDHIYTTAEIIEDLNLTPNEILAKYGEPDYIEEAYYDEMIEYENVSYTFSAHGDAFGSNDEHYNVTINVRSASVLGITDKIDVRDFIDSVDGKVFYYHHSTDDGLDENGRKVRRGKCMIVDILTPDDIVYELLLEDINFIDPDNDEDDVNIWFKDEHNLYYVDDINKDITAEFYAYLDENGYT